MIANKNFYDYPKRSPKRLKILAECESCGNSAEFFIGEVWHLCDSCFRAICYAKQHFVLGGSE